MALWVRISVVASALASVLVATAIGKFFVAALARGVGGRATLPDADSPAFAWFPLAAIAVGVAAYRAGRHLPRWVAATGATMLVHATVLAMGAIAWLTFGETFRDASLLPLMTRIPLWSVFVPAGAVVAIAAAPPRHASRAVDAVVSFALAHLLCVGVALPLASRWWFDTGMASHAPLRLVVVVLVGCAIAAIGVLVVARAVATNPARRRVGLALTLAAVATAVILMPGDAHTGQFFYSNVAHIVVGEAAFAFAALVCATVLRWRLLRASAPAGRTLEGRAVSDDGGPIGWIEYLGWLRGMRATTARFRLESADGPVQVPAGSQLAMPTPAQTAELAAGERVTLLESGATVRVTGIAASADGPFRGTLVADAGDLVVTGHPAAPRRLARSVLLWLWRPSVLYLAVVTAVALPPAVTAGTPYDADGATARVAKALGHEPLSWSAGPPEQTDDERAQCEWLRDSRRWRPADAREAPLHYSDVEDELDTARHCWEAQHLMGCPSAWNLLPYTYTAPRSIMRRWRVRTSCTVGRGWSWGRVRVRLAPH